MSFNATPTSMGRASKLNQVKAIQISWDLGNKLIHPSSSLPLVSPLNHPEWERQAAEKEDKRALEEHYVKKGDNIFAKEKKRKRVCGFTRTLVFDSTGDLGSISQGIEERTGRNQKKKKGKKRRKKKRKRRRRRRRREMKEGLGKEESEKKNFRSLSLSLLPFTSLTLWLLSYSYRLPPLRDKRLHVGDVDLLQLLGGCAQQNLPLQSLKRRLVLQGEAAGRGARGQDSG